MDFNLCGKIFRSLSWNSDMWQSVQLRYVEQAWNKSPWENDHKSQLVKPILMKPMVFEKEHARIPQYEVSDIEE